MTWSFLFWSSLGGLIVGLALSLGTWLIRRFHAPRTTQGRKSWPARAED